MSQPQPQRPNMPGRNSSGNNVSLLNDAPQDAEAAGGYDMVRKTSDMSMQEHPPLTRSSSEGSRSQEQAATPPTPAGPEPMDYMGGKMYPERQLPGLGPWPESSQIQDGRRMQEEMDTGRQYPYQAQPGMSLGAQMEYPRQDIHHGQRPGGPLQYQEGQRPSSYTAERSYYTEEQLRPPYNQQHPPPFSYPPPHGFGYPPQPQFQHPPQSHRRVAHASAQDSHYGAQLCQSKERRHPCKHARTHCCDKTFTTSGHASRHSKIHTAEKAVHCIFPGCSKRFTRNDNMKQHLATHNKDKNRASKSLSGCLTRNAGVQKNRGYSRTSQSYSSGSAESSPTVSSYGSPALALAHNQATADDMRETLTSSTLYQESAHQNSSQIPSGQSGLNQLAAAAATVENPSANHGQQRQ